jgi:hypothetical protein
MLRKIKNITSILLLLVFLLPSIVKLEHRQQHFSNIVNQVENSYAFNQKCGICDFEFFVFLSDNGNIDLQNGELLPGAPKNNFYFLYYSNLTQYSYSLRAPPLYFNHLS